MAIDLLGTTKLYCGVTTINRIYFQDGSDNRFISVDFSYNGGGNATFEVYIKGGVHDAFKPAFLLEVNSVLNSMFTDSNSRGYVEIGDIANKINDITL